MPFRANTHRAYYETLIKFLCMLRSLVAGRIVALFIAHRHTGVRVWISQIVAQRLIEFN